MLATPRDRHPLGYGTSTPFILLHFLPLLAIFTGVTQKAVILCVVSYVVRMFAITGGYHRYFSHRAFKLGRFPQFVLAFLGGTAAQKGVLWWAGHHRDHHRYSDTARDPHSPQKGFWWAHVGWILCDAYGETDYEAIEDYSRFPELRWLNEHDWVPVWLLAVASTLIAGWSGLIIGFFLSTVLLWHGTFIVNSLAHVMGKRRYATSDTSRNSAFVAFFTLGEGWHNNHHHYPACARQGFRWWEFDPTYWVLRIGAMLGIVKELRQPPLAVRESKRIRDGHLDVGRFRRHLAAAAATAPAEAAELIDQLTAMAERAGKRKITLPESAPSVAFGAPS